MGGFDENSSIETGKFDLLDDRLTHQVSELSCLCAMTQLALESDVLPVEELVERSLPMIRKALADRPDTLVQVIFRDIVRGDDPRNCLSLEQAPIMFKGEMVGRLILGREGDSPEKTSFTPDERGFLKAAGRQLSLVIQHSQTLAEYEELLKQLRHADRLATLGQLAAGVAHQLNEPLGSILGYAQLVKKEGEFSDQVSGDLQRIIDASLDAREVIRKLLLFARPMLAQRSQITLDQIVEEGLWFFESRCEAQKIELVRELANQEKTIYVDETQIRQVVVNLVVNAMQSMPDGGKLTVRTREEEKIVVLEVEDSGVGIEETLFDQIFVPFFTTKDVNEGTGLGLSIVHGIVKAHGGTIKVMSSPGKGSRFCVQFPVEAAEGAKE